jgi:hypothetical protein
MSFTVGGNRRRRACRRACTARGDPHARLHARRDKGTVRRLWRRCARWAPT